MEVERYNAPGQKLFTVTAANFASEGSLYLAAFSANNTNMLCP